MKFAKEKKLNLGLMSFLTVMLLLVTNAVYGDAENTDYGFTAEQMWQMKRVGDPVVSPDGNKIAFTITEYDIEKIHQPPTST